MEDFGNICNSSKLTDLFPCQPSYTFYKCILKYLFHTMAHICVVLHGAYSFLMGKLLSFFSSLWDVFSVCCCCCCCCCCCVFCTDFGLYVFFLRFRIRFVSHPSPPPVGCIAFCINPHTQWASHAAQGKEYPIANCIWPESSTVTSNLLLDSATSRANVGNG